MPIENFNLLDELEQIRRRELQTFAELDLIVQRNLPDAEVLEAIQEKSANLLDDLAQILERERQKETGGEI